MKRRSTRRGSGHRLERAAQDLRAKLASILERHVGDPRLQGVSISAVEPSPDYAYARVYVFAPGPAEEALEALDKARGYLRRCLGEDLRLRRVPELDFRIDESLARGARVDAVLQELEGEER